MEYRRAKESDAEAIAQLHVENWRRHYRGAYLDSYLDGDVVTDRLVVWTERLSEPSSATFTIVADAGGAILGFAHTILDHDESWGAYLENLHVAAGSKRRGVGRRLMVETARKVVERRPTSGLYLWVLEQNTAAQAFYDAVGGELTGREVRGPFPGGGRAFGLRYAWPDPRRLGTHGGIARRTGE